MLNYRRIILIVAILALLAILVQFVRVDFVNTTEGEGVLQASELNFKQSYSNEKVMIVSDMDDAILTAVTEQTMAVLDLMRIEYDYLQADAINQFEFDHDYIIMIISDLNILSDIEGFFDFISQGGKVLFPFRLEFNELFSGAYRFLGISEFGDFEDVTGVMFDEPIILKGDILPLEYSEHITNSSISVQLEEDVVRLMHAGNDLSLAWKYKSGKGQIVYFNGSILQYKDHRGILTGLINELRPVKAHPYMNVHSILVQHLPGPIPDGNEEHLLRDYNRSTLRFYKEIWWTDLLDITTRLNQVISSGLLGTYTEFTSSNLEDYYFIQRENLSIFGREILTRGGEIALNGFNPKPMILGEDWGTWAQIEEAYGLLEDYFKVIFTNYNFGTYIVPENKLSNLTYDFLRDKEIINFVSEFDYKEDLQGELYAGEYVELPIINHGYDDTPEKLWRMINMKSSIGYYLHSIYADEVIEDNFVWKDKYEGFFDYLEKGEDLYGHMKGVSLSDLSRAYMKTLYSPTYELDDNVITIRTEQSISMIIRLEQAIVKVEGTELKEIGNEYYYFEADEDVIIYLEN